MRNRDPERNFEALWEIFNRRYPFFELRKVNWQSQYDVYRPKVTNATSDDELFDILCEMLSPIHDGHINLRTKGSRNSKARYFNPEKVPRFWQEFTKKEIAKLFAVTNATLVDNRFRKLEETEAWMLLYCRSSKFGYIRILELEGIGKRKLSTALDTISRDFGDLQGLIVDIRNVPGGDDDVVISIVNRLCDKKRVCFHRRTKVGPGSDEFSPLKTWHIKPRGLVQFTKPIVLLTCDSVFSGGEVFAMTMRELPHVTVIGDHTNGIFSYQLEKKLPNGWECRLSYQIYYSADMTCYEAKGVPVDIELFNTKADLADGVDPLIVRALEVLALEAARSASV